MMRAPALTLFALLGCSTTHTLAPAPTASGTTAQRCSIGVASLRDEDGIDHALDLRDRLRSRGPCRTVVAVAATDAEGVDVVVGGKVDARVEPDLVRPAATAATVGLGIGAAAVAAGGVLLLTASTPQPDAQGFVSPSDRRSHDLSTGLGTGLLVGGAALAGLSFGGFVVESTAVREIALKARIDADVTMWRGGREVDKVSLHDDVVVRARHPHGRVEDRNTPAAHGPLYRIAMEHVLDHIASRVADVVEQEDAHAAPR
jgi:hypothetical protein